MKANFINIDYEFLTTSSFFLTKKIEVTKLNLLIKRDLRHSSLLKKTQALRRNKNSPFINVE